MKFAHVYRMKFKKNYTMTSTVVQR